VFLKCQSCFKIIKGLPSLFLKLKKLVHWRLLNVITHLCETGFNVYKKINVKIFSQTRKVPLAIDAFHCSVVLLCKINMKRQQKLTFFIEKRRAVEPPENDEEGLEKDGERSEESFTSQQLQQLSQLFM